LPVHNHQLVLLFDKPCTSFYTTIITSYQDSTPQIVDNNKKIIWVGFTNTFNSIQSLIKKRL